MKNVSKYIIMLATVGMLSLRAAEGMEKGKFYASGSYGVGLSNKFQFEHIHQDGQYLTNKPGITDVLGLAVGYGITDSVRAEIGYNRFNGIKYKSDFGSDVEDDGAYALLYLNQKQKAEAIFGTIFYDINKFGKIKPFISAGIGVSRNKSGSINTAIEEYDINGKTNDDTEQNFPSETKTKMAWKLGVGINYEINDKFDLNLINYQYNHLGEATTKVNNDDKKISHKLRVYSISSGITFKF